MKQQVAQAEQAKHLRAQHIYMQQQYCAPLPVAGWSSCTPPHHLVEDPRKQAMKQQVAEAEQAKYLRAQHKYMQQQYRAPLPVAGWSSCTQPHHLVEDPRNRQ